jgi:protein phosphatase
MVVANVGDSRVYLWRANELKQVSADHSYVQELLTEGYITADEARVHPRRNIVTRALGIEGDVMADSWVLPMLLGDRYLLCSDGLVDEVDDEAITDVLRTVANPQAAADRLVSIANTNGGRDNVTVIVVDVVEHVSAPQPSQPSQPTPARSTRRVLTAVTGVVLAVVLAIGAIGWYARGGYFVGFDGTGPDARLVVFKGRPASVLWFSPTVHLDSGVTRDDIFPALANDIAAAPVSYDSPDRAVAYVDSIRGVVEAQRPDGDS